MLYMFKFTKLPLHVQQQKDPQIQKMYHTLKDQLVNTTEEIDVAQLKETSIQNEIQRRS